VIVDLVRALVAGTTEWMRCLVGHLLSIDVVNRLIVIDRI